MKICFASLRKKINYTDVLEYGMDVFYECFRYYKDNRYLNINGLSIHIGSQICKIEPFRQAFKKIRNLVLSLKKKNILIDSLDIGGGIGIIYEVNKDKVFKISVK